MTLNFNKKVYGVYFNGHHSTDFGLDALDDKKVGFPSKRKFQVQPLFSNEVLDFSNVSGDQLFDERTFEMSFYLIDNRLKTKEGMYRVWTKVVNWLMSAPTKQPLYDDVMHNYYYLGEVVDEPSLEEFISSGILTIAWQCYPFRISALAEGNDIWDTFDFEFDIAQHTKFEIKGANEIVLYNLGTQSARPELKTSSNMTIIKDGRQFEIGLGITKSHQFQLVPGINKMTVKGNGTLEILWYKELI
ncbi:phage tail protein [Vagococcus xieshaowenii]|uniref:Phage tail protein n=1 Tax=Vagococcus xieshaowenii TaxID=2562451 RepID=A0AAJ5EEU4_9ENTE|nr:phage tail protein [Vagococcus xieshaowenii]QCA28260.1 phage tail protein [Vagococcus xieshaowenii]TFZ41915.1 phage tail protein [Vagococcus xieshaowenii]